MRVCGKGGRARRTFRARTGTSSCSGSRRNRNLLVLMERFDLLEDEELLQPLVWRERLPEVNGGSGRMGGGQDP